MLKTIMVERRLKLLSTLGCIVVFVAVYAFVFINFSLNLTGLIPVPISSTFENLKTAYRRTSDVVQTSEANASRRNTRVLIDIYKNSKKTTFFNSSNHKNSVFDILWYNKPVWVNDISENNVIKSQCTYNNCRTSTNETDIKNAAAVIFCLTEELGFMPPVPRKDRNPDQAWIFFFTEAPVYHFKMKYRHENWRNTMNWSMSYNLDADIFHPYGYLETKKDTAEKSYSSIFHRKNKVAAWAVSHCGARSKRDEFVSELASHGVQIDIFGKCSDGPQFTSKELKDVISKDYKFYLSFENSLCRDYVTEKFFTYYNLDVVLIVRGGLDYDKSLPNGTFINSAHFSSAKDLAGFITRVGSSEELYTTYLKNKDRYIAYTNPMTYTCSICEKLNKLNESRKTFVDHVTHIHKDTCWTPTDIPVSYNAVTWFQLGLALLLSFSICVVLIVWKWEKILILRRKIWSA